MNARGFTLLELLLASTVLAGILLGAGWFYLTAKRFELENRAQVSLQRQATLIMDELSKQIQPGTAGKSGPPVVASTIVIPCTTSGDPNSLQVTRARSASDPPSWPDPVVLCFRGTGDATGLLEDRPGGTWNLLTGAPATLSLTTGACPDSGGFCPTLVTDNGGNTIGAAITFRLRYRSPESNAFQTMTFTTTIAARN